MSTLRVLAFLGFDSAALGALAAAGLLTAIPLRASSRTVQLVLALGAPCLVGYASFWFYFFSPAGGRWATIAVTLALLAAGALTWARAPGPSAALVRSWALPAALVPAGAAFSLGLGFLHGGWDHAASTAAIRYIGQLPIDNVIPRDFALALLDRARPVLDPLMPAWHLSDRPPLQAGVYLLVRSLAPGQDSSTLHYQVLGTVLGCLWLPALHTLLTSMGAARGARSLALAATLFSGFAIVNTFYVWPKLLAGAFLLPVAAMVLTGEIAEARRSPVAGAACGVAAVLALLAHEGSLLALLPLALVFLLRSGLRESLLFLRPSAPPLVAGFLPWYLYQKLYEPPGDWLARLSMGGPAAKQSSLGFFEALAASYRQAGASGVLSNKVSNLLTPFSHLPDEVLGLIHGAAAAIGVRPAVEAWSAVASLRAIDFFFLFPALGLPLLGLPALLLALLRRGGAREPDVRAALWIWAWTAAALALWALWMFGPESTIIHQGSYLIELLAFAALAVGLWRLSPAAAVAVVAVQCFAAVLTYGLPEPAGFATPMPPPVVSSGSALLALAGLAATAALLHRSARRSDPPGSPDILSGGSGTAWTADPRSTKTPAPTSTS